MGFLLVGWGYRSRAWWEAARGTGVECLGVVVRTPRPTPAPTFTSLEDALAATGARFVVASVDAAAAPDVVRACVAAGVGVLTETPPAADPDRLRALWADVGASDLVQVAEQYPRYPSHAARRALVASGIIGTPTQAQVSSTQLHHAAALMRFHLGVAPGPATVRATTTTAPLLQPLTRAGWTGATEPEPATTTHAVIDLKDGRSGVYDFTDNQTRNLLRVRRLVVRGTHGELDGEDVVAWGGPETVLTSRIERRQAGHDLDMSGFATRTLAHGADVLWRNPWPGKAWSDDQLATADLLAATARWADGEGKEPYPLREGCQDAAIGFAIERGAAGGEAVRLTDEPWW
ncbi:hypothetical protein PCC79_15060 [Propioniciclava soli]|uniref:Gfo/Idh/MocA family oxidoreductase n=1 Tax=Propioniciclava soli TaxID=2775081 RepID=A0ABZ3C6K6_9ACTN